jgi:hypothetical protein
VPPKRKHLNLKQKKQLIVDNDAGETDLVKKFGIQLEMMDLAVNSFAEFKKNLYNEK